MTCIYMYIHDIQNFVTVTGVFTLLTRVERFARLRTFTRYYRDITRELSPVFTREIAFQRQNSLKFTRKLARNSFSRFEGDNHGHTPDLA